MNNSEFDYVIVGAGSAGCVLADRLSASGRHNVLLVEAGGSDRKFWIKVPLGYGMTLHDERVNWKYHTAPDPGLNERVGYWPRGRVLGGSSSINAMVYARGLPHDFDDWERAGATGWGWRDVRPVYDGLECHDDASDGVRKLRGQGPIRVSDVSDQVHPFNRHFLASARELGWPVTDDINGPDQEGLSLYRITSKQGRRWSAADAFLRPAMKRKNLDVVTGALVESLVVEGRRVTGVTFRRRGEQTTVVAKNEVVLSAGAINTPKLLQHSGIGPGDLLQRHGIEVRHHLPEVGEGLQDHLAITYLFRSTVPTANDVLGPFAKRMQAGIQYLLTRRGPLSLSINQCGGFIRSSEDRPYPEFQLYCTPISYASEAGKRPRIDPWSGFLLSAQPCRPTSRGHVRIASADPAAPPAIQANSLSSAKDCGEAVAAVRLIAELAGAPSLRRVTIGRPSLDLKAMNSDEILRDFRERAGTVYHPCCTCRMGSDASDSVVNKRLRVHGLEGLRVIDASAFPNVTSGNINAPVMMLAARAADMVLEDAAAGG